MKICHTAALTAALTLAGMSTTLAATKLTLRIEADSTFAGSHFALIDAEQGIATHSAHRPDDPTASYLWVLGQDAAGKELFRRRVRDPRILRAESFNPYTGTIEFARRVRLDQQQFEVQLPDAPTLASVQVIDPSDARTAPHSALTPHAATSAAAGSSNRIPIEQIRQHLHAHHGNQAARLVASDVLGSALLLDSGPASARLDILLLGDGYTANEMADWRKDAQQVANGLMNDPLFADQAGAINIRRVDVVSAQSGVTDNTLGIQRNTALHTVAGCSGIDRLVCADSGLAYAAAEQVTASDGRDVILVVANTTRYGGGGGYIATMTMHSAATELALHELGHTLFGLADEYDYGSCYNNGEPAAADVTRQTRRSAIKWASFIDNATPTPTPTGTYAMATVGLFEGGNYCAYGVYRPTENSRMRTLGYPWYAVNYAAGAAVFDSYHAGDSGNPGDGDDQPDSAATTVHGYLRGPGDYDDIPSPYHTSQNGGRIRATLDADAGADLDLYLYRWNGASWSVAAKSDDPGNHEALNLEVNPGYYLLEVYDYRGAGNYTLEYTLPE
ncbi:MAG TPA: M64 family metallopeptidase [Rhodanobacteraceae bacterium]|nr:M64 family metallopeptidase [Rhodanobacteraceae bacterium]